MPLLSHLGVSIEMGSKGPTRRQAPSVTKPRRKVLFSATVDVHILSFHIPYLKMLQGMDYETHVATNGQAEIPHCDVRHTVPFARSPIKLSNLRAIKQLRQIIEAEKFDLIHTHTPMGAVVTRLAAMRARKMYGTKVIYTAHGFHFYKGAPWHYWIIFYPIEKLLARVTDVLITINKEDYSRAKKKFKTDVQYVQGVGIDLEKFKPATKTKKLSLRQKYGFDKQDFILIYAAELNTNKNQRFLIKEMPRLLQRIPQAKLLLCGGGELHASYRELIDDLRLKNKVLLLGHRKDIDSLFQLADICVASSLREGLGVNLIEAMSTGLPIVASNNRGHRDIAGSEFQDYLFEHGDGGGYSNHVEILSGVNGESYIRLSKISRQLTQKYSIQAVLRVMRKLYSQMETKQ